MVRSHWSLPHYLCSQPVTWQRFPKLSDWINKIGVLFPLSLISVDGKSCRADAGLKQQGWLKLVSAIHQIDQKCKLKFWREGPCCLPQVPAIHSRTQSTVPQQKVRGWGKEEGRWFVHVYIQTHWLLPSLPWLLCISRVLRFCFSYLSVISPKGPTPSASWVCRFAWCLCLLILLSWFQVLYSVWWWSVFLLSGIPDNLSYEYATPREVFCVCFCQIL